MVVSIMVVKIDKRNKDKQNTDTRRTGTTTAVTMALDDHYLNFGNDAIMGNDEKS